MKSQRQGGQTNKSITSRYNILTILYYAMKYIIKIERFGLFPCYEITNTRRKRERVKEIRKWGVSGRLL